MHGLRVGMHGQKRCSKPRNGFDASSNRIANIVQLEVEEAALTGARQHAREVDAAGKGELITDLVERDGITEPCNQRLRLADRRHIKRDDQPSARIELHGRCPPSFLPYRLSSRPLPRAWRYRRACARRA